MKMFALIPNKGGWQSLVGVSTNFAVALKCLEFFSSSWGIFLFIFWGIELFLKDVSVRLVWGEVLGVLWRGKRWSSYYYDWCSVLRGDFSSILGSGRMGNFFFLQEYVYTRLTIIYTKAFTVTCWSLFLFLVGILKFCKFAIRTRLLLSKDPTCLPSRPCSFHTPSHHLANHRPQFSTRVTSHAARHSIIDQQSTLSGS